MTRRNEYVLRPVRIVLELVIPPAIVIPLLVIPILAIQAVPIELIAPGQLIAGIAGRRAISRSIRRQVQEVAILDRTRRLCGAQRRIHRIAQLEIELLIGSP